MSLANDMCSLVRTDFSDDAAWAELLELVNTQNAEGFQAYVTPVDDRVWEGASPAALRDAAKEQAANAAIILVADKMALTAPENPVLVVQIMGNEDESDTEPVPPAEPPAFRCIVSQLWSAENNLTLFNMDWEDFTDAIGEDGIFRGFPEC